MKLTNKVRFLNFFRNIFRLRPLEYFLAYNTKGKGYDDFFVKCLPQNYQYKKGSFRIVNRDGIRYRVDLSEYMEWVIFFGLDVEEREGLYPLIKKGMVVLDVGTNIGETLLHFANITGTAGKVYGFEPVDENFRKCLYNVALNDFKNIQVSQVALSDKREMLYFGLAGNSNSGGIFMQKEKVDSLMTVQALTLDEFVKENNISAVDLIKIDVEGFELNVLKGASETLKKYMPVLFVEVDGDNLKRQGYSPKQLENLLTDYGYGINAVGGKPAANQTNVHYDIICKPLKS